MKSNLYIIIIISVITFTVFGFLDSFLFGILLNTGILQFLENRGLNIHYSDISVGAISASLALLISHYIKHQNSKIFEKVIEHPLLDVMGIMLGTSLYIVVMIIYNKTKQNKLVKNIESKSNVIEKDLK